MSPPAGAWILSGLLIVLVSTSVDSQVEEVICGVADLGEDGSEYIKPFTCENPGGDAPVQSEKGQIPAEGFPWIGILSNSISKEKTCLGVIISQDLVVASKPCENSASYTFEISHLNFTSDLSVVPPIAGVSSENDILVFKLEIHLPSGIYRPTCVPDQHFVPKAVKATDSCQGDTNTLLKVSLKGGKIVSSKSNILTDKECADNILLTENSACWNNFDNTQNPCMTIDQTIQRSNKYDFKNYEDYTCHRGILEATSKCQLDGIIGESNCVGIPADACIGNLPHNKNGEFHKCRKEVVKYTKCITEEFIKITNNDKSQYPFSGVNCLHSYLPKRPECAKHSKKKGLLSLGSEWAFDKDKIRKSEIKKCKRKKTLSDLKCTDKFDWLRWNPYEGKWSISMLKEMMEVNTCIVKGTGCDICSSTGGSVCINQANDSGETEFVFWYESCRDRWFFLGPSTTGKREKICPHTHMTELPFLEQNTQLIREYASTHSAKKITLVPLYPKPVFVMLGNTGVGKSTVANALLMGHAGNKQCFKTSGGASSQTKLTKLSKGKWLGVGQCVTLIDTPGTQDTGGKQRDYENVMNIMEILKDEVKQIDVFVVLFNGRVPRFGQGIQAALNTYEALFGKTFWNHVVTEFSFWNFANNDMKLRYAQHCRELKDCNVEEDKKSCNHGEVCLRVEEGPGSAAGPLDPLDEDEEEDALRRRKRSIENQSKKNCMLMIEDKGSFASETVFENITYSNGLVSKNFWDQACGWRDLPEENIYPVGWNQGSKDVYNKADFISRYIKADSWNEKYEEEMGVLEQIPSVFINPLWAQNKLGCERFQRETSKLWDNVQKFDAYSCSNKCEAPESYFNGKPYIFGEDTIYIEESPTPVRSRLHCSVWSGVKGAAGTIDVEWYYSDNKQLHVSENPSDLFSVKIKEDDGRSNLNSGGPKNYQSLQLSINHAKITHSDIGLYYCFLENHPPGSKPTMERGTLVSNVMREDGIKSKTSIIVTCDIFEISEEQMKIKLRDVKWFFAKKIIESQSTKYAMSLDSEAKHDQFSVQKLKFNKMDDTFEGNYSCQVGGQFSAEVKVNMNVDATWSEWGSWGSCNASCGYNRYKTQFRTCHPSKNKGISCDALKKKAVNDGNYADIKQNHCGYQCCPIHGKWSNWQRYSECSQKCYDTTNLQAEYGEKRRQRKCNGVACGGEQCIGDVEEVSPCNTHKCPIHGGWSQWSGWSDCIKDPEKCYGTLEKTRTCTNPVPQHGGKKCPGDSVKTKNCDPLCPVNCKPTDWGDWSTCSKTCKPYKTNEQGTRTRQRGSIPATDNGQTCQQLGIDLTETENCDVNQYCPRDVSWGQWNDYGSCNNETGMKRRDRSCYFKDSNGKELFNKANSYGGHGCVGDKAESTNCPVECTCTAPWSLWETCTAKCFKSAEKLVRKKQRTCMPAKNGGKECTDVDTTQEEVCPIPRCGYNIDGLWSDWGQISKCPVECGGGFQTKKRTCTHPQKESLILMGDYDDTKDILGVCAGRGIQVHTEQCNLNQCSINSLTFVMDTSCSFDGSDQDTAKQLAEALMAELDKENIDVPSYRVIGSPGSRDVQVLPIVTTVKEFKYQYTDLLVRKQCGAQWNLKAILWTLQNGAKHGAVIVLYTDTGTSETNSDELTKDIAKEVANRRATIIIFITPTYTGNEKSMTQYRRISFNNVYVMSKHKAKDVIAVVKRNLRKSGDGVRCIASGGPMWPITQYECKFPFKYEGVEYKHCTDTDHVQRWCSTFVDVDGIHQDGKVGLCGDCSGLQDPACSTYTVLNEGYRNVKNLGRVSSNADYNRATWSGYYRFESPAGIKLPENGNDVRQKEAWIKQEHPKVKELVQRKTICFGPQCSDPKDILTITCSSNRGESFHLYKLEKPPGLGYSYVAQKGTCPTNWVSISQTCISVSTDKLSWEDAETSCTAKGGHLFEPQDEYMNSKVWKYVKLAEKIEVVAGYWLAFNDKTKEGNFGSSMSKFWLPGRPRADNSINCVNVITKSGKWTDSTCSTKLHYICQRNQNS